ncbi:hypothetical protein CW745_10975 [Psychromonas sp. psych-6C06]|uniref:DUF3461 family protein n=1 Tax=Psychromonas sp. psych-6C06 TaxID=2058089 RepID=UPI000C32A3EB|nr:DUF3461 family protein [Psychromonas sp. psych-6C06]PKF61826.1 hypothetical protein CW745_10975 [Psychromonas sp. psych-6C06]
MHSHLKSIGIRNVEDITRYSLRQEGERDILKVYFKKTGHEFLARSSKFKFQRQQKRVSGGYQGDRFTNMSEINPTLRKIIKELDALAIDAHSEKEVKQQLLNDLKHLESVVTNKVKEMEAKIAQL